MNMRHGHKVSLPLPFYKLDHSKHSNPFTTRNSVVNVQTPINPMCLYYKHLEYSKLQLLLQWVCQGRHIVNLIYHIIVMD